MEFLALGILWIIYSFSEGIREGYADHQKSLLGFNKREKYSSFVFAQRCLILLIFTYPLFLSNVMSSLIFFIGAISVFVYIQNGIYFLLRNKLNPKYLDPNFRCDFFDHPIVYLNSRLRSRLAFFGVLLQSFLWLI
jgi:hypothetical protein